MPASNRRSKSNTTNYYHFLTVQLAPKLGTNFHTYLSPREEPSEPESSDPCEPLEDRKSSGEMDSVQLRISSSSMTSWLSGCEPVDCAEEWDPVAREAPKPPAGRSEEHTSELQSRFDLVCRLLLEKKKS